MNLKIQIRRTAIFVAVCYWCLFTANTDGYGVPYVLVALLGVWAAARRGQNPIPELRGRKAAGVCGGALSAAVALANYNKLFQEWSGATQKLRSCIELLLVLAGGFFLFREIFYAIAAYIRKQPEREPYAWSPCDKWVLLGAWAGLLLIYGGIFYALLYPGILSVDSLAQVQQALSGQLNNAHPVCHTLIIRLCLLLGLKLFGDINAAVAIYSVLSLSLLSLCFAYTVCTVYQVTRKKLPAICTLLFYSLMPFHIIYSVTMWKDVPFAIAVTFFLVSTFRLLCHIGRSNRRNWAISLASMIGVCLLRNNGMLAFGISIPIFFLLFRKREKNFLLSCLAAFCCCFIIKYPVLNALNVEQPDSIEVFSLQMQQISRVIVDGGTLTQEQQELLGHLVQLDRIPTSYSPIISDPIKMLVRETGDQEYLVQHKGDFAKLYFQLGIRYPISYLTAWIDQTKGYWNGGYDYWKWTMSIEPNELGIVRTQNVPVLANVFGAYSFGFASSPILQAFLSIGLYTWLMLAAAYAAWYKRDRSAVFTLILPMAVVLSLLAGTPVYAEFRYAYCVYCSAPLFLTACFSGKQRKKD